MQTSKERVRLTIVPISHDPWLSRTSSTGFLGKLKFLGAMAKDLTKWVENQLFDVHIRRKPGPYSQLIHELRQASSGRIALQILLVRDSEYEFKINSYGVAGQAV